jgi:hypothetical protein
MSLQTSVPRKLTLEELIPEDAPQPVLSKNAGKTARVRLTPRYLAQHQAHQGDRLYAGQVVALPEKEARGPSRPLRRPRLRRAGRQ